MRKDVLFSQKRMGFKKYQKSSVFQKILSNPEIARKLDRPGERYEFYNMMKEKMAGGVTKQEMKQIFGELMSGKGRTIDRKEAYAIAKEFFPDEARKYTLSSKPKTSASRPGRDPALNLRKNPGANAVSSLKAGNSLKNIPGLAASVYGAGKITEEKSDSEKKDQESSFFRAMRATLKNKN